jgi:type II secretion system protein N
VRRFLESRLSTAIAGMEIGVGRTEPVLPLGLEIAPLSLSRRNGGSILVRAEAFTIEPAILSLLRGKHEGTFEGRVHQGRIHGNISLGKKGLKSPLRISAAFKGISVKENPWIQEFLARPIEGSLEGELTWEGTHQGVRSGKGEAAFLLSNGNLGHLQLHPLWRINMFSFKEARIQATFQDETLSVKRIEFGGGQIGGELSGRIRPAPDILASAIQIHGELRPSSEYLQEISDNPELLRLIRELMKKGTISITISGTMREPVLELLEAQR